tara:strand:- start:686 stop:970 length:285 start_codon:yes stop_codon:yes gene_type:complete
MSLKKFYNSKNYVKIILTFVTIIASIFTITFITVFSLGVFVFGPMEDIQQEKFRKENHYLSHEYQMNQMDTIINELKIMKDKKVSTSDYGRTWD